MRNSLFLVLIPFLFTACVNEQNIEFKKPPIQVIRKVPIVKKKKGSLYSLKGPSLFADKKDLQIGDIIQVKISETLSSTTNNKREVSSDRKNSLGGGLLTPTTGNTLSGLTSSVAKKFNPALGVDFGSTTTSANNGEVKTKLSETFSSNVSSVIEETYQNGNYYIKGFKEMLIDGQKQTLMLTGIIRPYDITSDNSISSSQVANLKILYQKDGEEQDVLKVPWGLSIIQKFWPF
jgi:flagellar L-ring protein precursor FlgH